VRALSAATHAHIREIAATEALGETLVAFVEAVVLQVAHPLGGMGEHQRTPEVAVANQVIGLLGRSLGGEGVVADAADELAAEPAMLAAFFQNLDLLPAGGHRAADAVALLVVLALSRLEETGRPPGL
jgi:hypothetical protein